jgi:hypothetical protein
MKLLTSSDYFDMALLETVKSAEVALSLRKGFENGLRVQIIPNSEGYEYEIGNSFNKLTSYTAKQLRQWINEGDIVDAQEYFINVYKNAYGCKPRNIGTPKQWRDLNWLRYMTQEIQYECDL